MGGFLGGLIHSVAHAVGGLGIPVISNVARAVDMVTTPSAPRINSVIGPSTLVNAMQGGPGGSLQVRGPSFQGPSFSAGPNGFSVQGPSYNAGGGSLTVGGPGGRLPSGYHYNKTDVRAAIMQANRGGLTPGMQRAENNVVNHIVRNRRMNVLNYRAAKHAIRRVKGAMKALHRIERAMPHRTVHTKAKFGRKR